METVLEEKRPQMLEVGNKKILVIGLGLSGIAAAKFLKQRGAKVRCTDSGSGSELERVRAELEKMRIPVEIGRHTVEFLAETELVIASPGVPPWAVPIALAEERGVPIIGEMELAWRFCRNPVAAITGSNGKSTVTTLLHEVLGKAGISSRLCGNIGFPLVEQVTEADEGEILVTEVSSFQLERTMEFKPRISVILNITQDHLDRHRSMAEYLNAKLRILDNQDDSCFAVLNENLRTQVEKHVEGKTGPRLVFFGRGAESEIMIHTDRITARIPGFAPGEILRSEIKHLKGEHNWENAAAVMASAMVLGAGLDSVKSVLNEFMGLEHRLEYVDEIDGVRYINDSKATTVDAVRAALDTVGDKIILIAGGRDKGSDFQPLREPLSEKVKAVVLIGEAAPTLTKIFQSCVKIELAADMRDAVEKSRHAASAGDTVLLSPACASFDMFKSFEERGDTFKKEVGKLRHKEQVTTKSKEGTR